MYTSVSGPSWTILSFNTVAILLVLVEAVVVVVAVVVVEAVVVVVALVVVELEAALGSFEVVILVQKAGI